MVVRTGRKREAAKMKPARFDQILSLCSPGGKTPEKRHFWFFWCCSAKRTAARAGHSGGLWSHRLQPPPLAAGVHPPTPALALAFHPNPDPKTSTSPRAQGLEADKAGKAALSPKNRLTSDGLRSIKTANSAKLRRRSRPALIRFFACDRKAAKHRKSGTLGSFGAAQPKEPPPAQGIWRALGATGSHPALAEGVLPLLPILQRRQPRAASLSASPLPPL